VGSYLIIIVVLFGALWLFLIRPQKRRQVETSRMQDDLAAGDEILTAGGVYGTVRAIEDDVVELEIAPGTIVRLDRRAVAAVVPEETEPEPEEIEAEAEDSPSPGES
jgi:preprotein translocase subunit YajC